MKSFYLGWGEKKEEEKMFKLRCPALLHGPDVVQGGMEPQVQHVSLDKSVF